MVKDFVQDKYYEKGHALLKVRETVTALILWIVLLAPILVAINSLSPQVVWSWLYRWTWAEGRELADFLLFAITLAFIVIMILSVILLIRNNYFVKKVYPNRHTYDIVAMQQRKLIMETLYAQRFGSAEQRENARYYDVHPEQNFSEGTIDKLFKAEGCEIK